MTTTSDIRFDLPAAGRSETRDGDPVTRVDGYAPISDYAAIGDGRVAALVARDGAIDWLCAPRFDSPTVFAALLDAERGGRFNARARGGVRVGAALPAGDERRRDDLHDARRRGARRRCAQPRGRPAASVARAVRRVEGVSGRVPMRWRVEPGFGYAQEEPEVRRLGGVVTALCGEHRLAVHAFGVGDVEFSKTAAEGAFVVGRGLDRARCARLHARRSRSRAEARGRRAAAGADDRLLAHALGGGRVRGRVRRGGAAQRARARAAHRRRDRRARRRGDDGTARADRRRPQLRLPLRLDPRRDVCRRRAARARARGDLAPRLLLDARRDATHPPETAADLHAPRRPAPARRRALAGRLPRLPSRDAG